jgi:hypothetical protein
MPTSLDEDEDKWIEIYAYGILWRRWNKITMFEFGMQVKIEIC